MAKKKSAKTRITAKQKSARRKNMAIARKAKKKSYSLDNQPSFKNLAHAKSTVAVLRGRLSTAKGKRAKKIADKIFQIRTNLNF